MTFKKLLICILTFSAIALLSACATTMPPPGADAYRPVEYKFDYGDDLTALQAIALAGGFTYRADQRVVFLKRAGDTVERSYEFGQGRTIYVAPGDTIRIGERYF